MTHLYEEREDGVARCVVCFCTEGELLARCPGRPLNVDARRAILAGRVVPITMAQFYRLMREAERRSR